MPDQSLNPHPDDYFDLGTYVPVPVEDIRSLVGALEKALRADQLYDVTNPARRRFVGQLRESFQELWKELGRLEMTVEVSSLMVEGETIYENDDQANSLAFLLYKDGLRQISFLPGVEIHELEALLTILNRARQVGPEGDDLLNLLWDADLEFVEYEWVNLLSEGVQLPEAGMGAPPEDLEEMAEEGEAVPTSAQDEGAARIPLISLEGAGLEQFDLDPTDMEHFRQEIEREIERDLRADVLAALLDRFEDPQFPEQRPEIVEIFHTLLPSLLAANEFGAAGTILSVLTDAEEKTEGLPEELRQEISKLLDEVSAPETLGELLSALAEGNVESPPEDLRLFISYLRVDALRPLVRASAIVTDEEVPDVIREGVGSLAQENPRVLMKLAEDDDVVVVKGALRLIGALALEGAAPILAKLTAHPDPSVRKAAVEAGVQLKSSVVAGALESRLDDEVRDVRLAALHALAELRYQPAAPWLKAAISDPAIRTADLQEQIALFETFGALAGEEEVAFLEKLLGGSRWFRSEPKEIRACAALALGKMSYPAAEAALKEALTAKDPVVRSAVGRALEGGGHQ